MMIKPFLFKSAVTLFCSVSLSSMTFAQDIFELKGIQFEQSKAGTKILIQANDNVPYRLISANDKTITMEIDSVDSAKTIATDFSRADNVHHVALKPLGSNSVRVVIAGDELGHPFISIKNLRSAEAIAEAAQGDTDAFALESFSEMSESVLPETTNNNNNKDTAIAAANTALNEAEALAETSELEPLFDETASEEKPLPFPENIFMGIGELLVESPQTILFGLIGLLGLLVGAYSILKVLSLVSARKKTLAHLNAMNTTTKATQKTVQSTVRQGQSPFGRTQNGQGFKPQQSNEVVPSTSASQQQHLAGLRPSANELVSRTNAMQQYQQAAKPTTQRPGSGSRLGQESQRAREVSGRWGQPSKPAQRNAGSWAKNTPSFPAVRDSKAQHIRRQAAQGGNNPEVTTFLRSIADLMEKDGKPELAQEIKKTLVD